MQNCVTNCIRNSVPKTTSNFSFLYSKIIVSNFNDAHFDQNKINDEI